MRKNKFLTIWAVLVFAFLAIPLFIITVTAFGGGSAITFPIESCQCICLKILPPVFYYQPGSGISGNFYLPFSGYPRSLCPGKIWYEGKRIFKICFPVPYYCAGDRYRFYYVPVPDLNLKNPGICRAFSRSFYGNTAICDPCCRFFYGAV